MTQDKDLKRLVRARMAKTGESYTAARAVVLARGTRGSRSGDDDGASTPVGTGTAAGAPRRGPGTPRRDAAPRAEWAALAGMRDDAVREKTGRDWSGWVAALDRDRAWELSHRDIARRLVDAHGLGAWWSQTVTVGYERIRGLRAVGQRPDGSYDANKSRTFPVGVSELYRACRDVRHRRKWLPTGVTRVRTATVDTSIRFDGEDGTRVRFFLVSKGAGKSTLSVQHARLGGPADVERAKRFWGERLDALGALLRG